MGILGGHASVGVQGPMQPHIPTPAITVGVAEQFGPAPDRSDKPADASARAVDDAHLVPGDALRQVGAGPDALAGQ